jgi:hypothetical protein
MRALQAELIAIESLLALGRMDEAEQRLGDFRARWPGVMSGIWENSCACAAGCTRPPAVRPSVHDFGQSVSVFDLLGGGISRASSYLELGRLAAACGTLRHRYLTDAATIFQSLGASPDLPMPARR